MSDYKTFHANTIDFKSNPIYLKVVKDTNFKQTNKYKNMASIHYPSRQRYKNEKQNNLHFNASAQKDKTYNCECMHDKMSNFNIQKAAHKVFRAFSFQYLQIFITLE